MIVLQGERQRVEFLRFSADGRLLVAPCVAGLQVWDDLGRGGGPSAILGQAPIWSVHFTPDERKMVLGPHALSVIDLATHQAVAVPLEQAGGATACGLSPDGNLLVIAQAASSRTGVGRLFCRPLGELTASLWSVRTSTIYEPLLFLAGGERFVTLEWRVESNPIRYTFLYVTRDVRTGRALSEVPAGTDVFHSPVLSADRRWIARRRGIWATVSPADDLSTELVRVRNDNRRELTGLAFHPSGRYLAATSNDATVKLFDTSTWKVAHAFDWDIGRLRSVAFSPDGMLAAAGGDRGQIVVWDVDL
jgi:WD40 repeat protein